ADYHPYTVTHVVTQLQLLLFASLAFVVLMRSGVYPEEKRAEVLDTDVFYRRLLPPAVGGISRAIAEGNRVMRSDGVVTIKSIIGLSKRAFGPAGFLSRAWSTGMMTFWATLMLAFYLILYYMELG
ncbi:MAG: Na(+)/H(+) antiporter subunit D, partial [Planctomycetota bacterium]